MVSRRKKKPFIFGESCGCLGSSLLEMSSGVSAGLLACLLLNQEAEEAG